MALSSLVTRKKAPELSSTGLRIVIVQVSEVEECYYPNPNSIVVKSGLKSLTQTTPIITSSVSNSKSKLYKDGGFLKYCHFCKETLCPRKDVYMYRGNQGFCSKECRSKQISADETKEANAKTTNRLKASTIAFADCQGCETCKLLEDLRRRRNRRKKEKCHYYMKYK